MAGHASPTVTLSVYAHQFEAAKRTDAVRAKLEAIEL